MSKVEFEQWKGAGIVEAGYPRALWNLVSNFALSYLEKGRRNWDVPHTQSVVEKAFILATDFNLRVSRNEIRGHLVDTIVIVTAAWLHDIGYYKEFTKEARLDEVMDKKEKHMLVGEKMAGEFLSRSARAFLTEEQINMIAHLVGVHDNLESIETVEETILLEADTLGSLDTSWVEPTFRGQEALDFLEMERTKKRHSLFKTPLGKQYLEMYLEEFHKFIMQRDFS